MGLKRQTAATYTRIALAPQIRKALRTSHLSIDSFLNMIRAGKRAERAKRREEAANVAINAAEDNGILLGDSLDWLKAQPDGSIPFFVTDPPYGVGLRYDDWREPGDAEAYAAWFLPFWREMRRVVQPGGSVIMWQSYAYLRHVWRWFGDDVNVFGYGFYCRGLHIWTPLVHWQKEGAPLVRTLCEANWLIGTQSRKHQDRHPCPKPIEDCRQVIRRYTLPGALVVDPFAGVGSIPLACQLEGRRWLGIERSPVYVARARERLAEAMTAVKMA